MTKGKTWVNSHIGVLCTNTLFLMTSSRNYRKQNHIAAGCLNGSAVLSFIGSPRSVASSQYNKPTGPYTIYLFKSFVSQSFANPDVVVAKPHYLRLTSAASRCGFNIKYLIIN